MTPKKRPPKPYVFIGGSITSRDESEAKEIANRLLPLCRTLDRLGFAYSVDVLANTSVHREAKQPEFEIPKKFSQKVSKGLVKSINGLRVNNSPYDLKDEIACYYWSLDELERASACIWDLTKSSSGSGFELALAIQMRKPCLVLFDRPTVSTMINGCTSRLLTVRRWDEKIEKTIESFLKKATRGLDRDVRFSVSHETHAWLPKAAAAHEMSVSEYLRYLIEQHRNEFNQSEEK